MKTLTLFIISVIAGLAIGGGVVAQAQENRTLKQVQTGKIELWCEFEDGLRQVPADRVTGLYDGQWEFKNGHARQCELR